MIARPALWPDLEPAVTLPTVPLASRVMRMAVKTVLESPAHRSSGERFVSEAVAAVLRSSQEPGRMHLVIERCARWVTLEAVDERVPPEQIGKGDAPHPDGPDEEGWTLSARLLGELRDPWGFDRYPTYCAWWARLASTTGESRDD